VPNFSTKEKALLSRLAGKGGLNAQEGTIGGWTITDTKLKSSGENIARIELDKTTVSLKLYDAYNNEILRIGADDTDRGLFIYDTDGNQLARYVSDEIFIGEATKYLKYTAAGGLEIAGTISASTIDIGGADATSFHVDVNGNMWLGAAAFASGPFRVSNAGAVTASAITITGGVVGGFTPDAAEGIYVGDGATRVQMKPGAGIWCGATAIGSAPFRVTAAGALTAASATITGVITANTGYVGGTSGFTIASGKMTAAGIGFATTTGDGTYALWIGDNTPGSAEFRVTHAGVLTCSGASIRGTLNADDIISGTLTVSRLNLATWKSIDDYCSYIVEELDVDVTSSYTSLTDVILTGQQTKVRTAVTPMSGDNDGTLDLYVYMPNSTGGSTQYDLNFGTTYFWNHVLAAGTREIAIIHYNGATTTVCHVKVMTQVVATNYTV
jgi:hypothetical protein